MTTNKDHQIKVRVTEKQLKDVQKRAERDGLSVSELIRFWIIEKLRKPF